MSTKFKVGDKVWAVDLPLMPLEGWVSSFDEVLGYQVKFSSTWNFMDDKQWCEHELYSRPDDAESMINRLTEVVDDINDFCEKLERQIEDDKEQESLDKELYDEARAGIAREE